MKGGGRRGRRGGRRQRRREEQQRVARAAEAGRPAGESPAPESPSGESPHGAEAESAAQPTPPVQEGAGSEPDAPTPAAPPRAARPEGPAGVPEAAPPPPSEHVPLSARELFARREAKRLEAEGSAADAGDPAAAEADVQSGSAAEVEPEPVRAERRFTADGSEWLARVVGRGLGGTGVVAQANLEAIRFYSAAAPDEHAAEVLVPRAKLDEMYDDELAELLERGLRSRTGNDG